jgi:hypothetical protein
MPLRGSIDGVLDSLAPPYATATPACEPVAGISLLPSMDRTSNSLGKRKLCYRLRVLFSWRGEVISMGILGDVKDSAEEAKHLIMTTDGREESSEGQLKSRVMLSLAERQRKC